MAQPAELFADIGAAPLARRERRPLNLAAYAMLRDGSLINVTLVDVSYDGCGIVCTTNLTAGEQIELAIVGRGKVMTTVRWIDGARAGLSFSEDADTDTGQHSRCHDRVSIQGEATLRRAGKISFRVRLYDLSPDGCKAEFVERPELNEQLWIKFDGMEALEAHVRWLAGANAGLKFARPIHAAVFDMLVARLRTGS